MSRILLVEDEPEMQALAQKVLKHGGYEVELATTGEEAVTRAQDNNVVLVLMDLALPELDGWEATTIIKSRRPDLSVVAVSANAMTTDRQHCIDAGCDGFLAKPYGRQELLNIVGGFMPAKSISAVLPTSSARQLSHLPTLPEPAGGQS